MPDHGNGGKSDCLRSRISICRMRWAGKGMGSLGECNTGMKVELNFITIKKTRVV